MNINYSILMDIFFIMLLIWSSISDLKSRVVSNKVIVILLCIGIANLVYIINLNCVWWYYLAGFLLAIPFFIAWLKNKMGAGDVKLIMGIGLYLGIFNTIIAFVVMLVCLLMIAIYTLIKKKSLKQQIPFAPLIFVGVLGVFVMKYMIL